MKKLSITLLAGIIFIILSGCNINSNASENNKIVVGSSGSDAQVWNFISKSKAAKEAGIEIEVKEFNDGLQINEATNDGILDVNAFQSLSYFQDYVKSKNADLAAIATTYLEPMGIYSKRLKSLEEIPENAGIAIPNDPANTARALRVLRNAGVITLKDDFDSFGTIQDIVENPKNIKFVPVDGSSTARSLPDVDASLIGNSIALDAGLNSIKDSIYHEEVNQDTQANINILVTQKENEKNENFKKLSSIYHSKEVQEFIKKEFGGTKIPVKKPVEEIINN
ncbi:MULTISPECIES: MetQ/NlpA family ABC transporter substrate-binding protein [Metabacillus]|uniref:MetQ/NlpA family ABC transporter substrate-binding protein n=1 Tax=Metabacillus hrfriensis TaxID=3048891 RepID=A0ACD4R6J7_9BACI|nr:MULTISPECIES: MetQ/NlpA family ABC transporter substrate-binding protein [Metabacillus]UAL50609.1 metal ABC transporter substrate-binding protein [Metabacillus dongyingensis]UOK56673.1 MetQ/NlpA family ABC transporter substrate-binding protein [Bacillus sp. OVS6]USK26875.1 MetQ/NlpA family ABC transporter substrate-binding protein [Bacillus sp. CMF21]WHZ56105.1 MetQ/NlpA family ABC transporter substrate-binding protein [Metabacillus sp. CT-WN-B3]